MAEEKCFIERRSNYLRYLHRLWRKWNEWNIGGVTRMAENRSTQEEKPVPVPLSPKYAPRRLVWAPTLDFDGLCLIS